MVKKRKPGRPKGSRNKKSLTIKDYVERILDPTVTAMKDKNKWQIKDINYIKDYPSPASFRSRLEAATVKFEQAINETIEQLKGT